MTRNSIDYKNAKTKEKDLNETKRSNRVKEKETKRHNIESEGIEKAKTGAGFGGNLIKALATVAKGFINDPEWYNLNPELTESVGNLPYFVPRRSDAEEGVNTISRNFANPIKWLVVQWVPSIGKFPQNKFGYISPINLAAKSIDAYMRSMNSRSSGYDPSDVMMMQLFLDSSYAILSYFKMIYRLLVSFQTDDFTYPKRLFKVLGVDYDDLKSNLSGVRYLINQTIIQLRTYPLINKFNIFKRHQVLGNYIFVDSEDYSVATKVIFRPRGYWLFSETSGTKLQWVDFPAKLDYSTMQSVFDKLITALVSSESVQMILADLYHAYDSTKDFFILEPLESIPEDITKIFRLDKEINSQLINATYVGHIQTAGLEINQDTEAQLYQGDSNKRIMIDAASINDLSGTSRSVPFNYDDVDAEPVTLLDVENWPSISNNYYLANVTGVKHPLISIAISRFTSRVKAVQNTSKTATLWELESCGTEILEYIIPCTYQATKFTSCNVLSDEYNAENFYGSNSFQWFRELMGIFTFDYSPRISLAYIAEDAGGTTGKLYYTTFVSDVYPSIQADSDTLDKMHAVAVTSLFGVTNSALSYK